MMRERGASAASSAGRPKLRADRMDSTMTMGRPTMRAESRKSSGRMGVHHSGLSLEGAISMSAPSEDWCMQESTTPATTKTGSARRTTRCSARAGLTNGLRKRASQPRASPRAISPSSSAGAISTVNTKR